MGTKKTIINKLDLVASLFLDLAVEIKNLARSLEQRKDEYTLKEFKELASKPLRYAELFNAENEK